VLITDQPKICGLIRLRHIPCSLLQDKLRVAAPRSQSEGGSATSQFRFDTPQLAAGSFISAYLEVLAKVSEKKTDI